MWTSPSIAPLRTQTVPGTELCRLHGPQISQLRQEREAAAQEAGSLKSRLAAADARLAQMSAEAQHSSEASAFAREPAAAAAASAPTVDGASCQ